MSPVLTPSEGGRTPRDRNKERVTTVTVLRVPYSVEEAPLLIARSSRPPSGLRRHDLGDQVAAVSVETGLRPTHHLDEDAVAGNTVRGGSNWHP
jgi:hypothetical protein